MKDIEKIIIEKVVEKISVEQLIEKMDMDVLTDKIAEKVAQYIISNELCETHDDSVGTWPWSIEPNKIPIPPITVMYGVTPNGNGNGFDISQASDIVETYTKSTTKR